jgi:pimeloyl-ACP methyl ester carboxylesterase
MMIHGMYCAGWAWDNYKAFFESKGYRCIAPTLRYHNVTHDDPPNPRLGTTSLLDYIHDLEEEIRQLDKPPILMGHSMGGLLAQILVARSSAESLVLLTPAAPRGVMALKWTVIKSFWDDLTTYGFWKKPIKGTFENTIYSTLHLVPRDKQKEIFDKLVYESGRAAWEMGFWLLDKNRSSEVDESRIICPVLVIAATEDRLTPPVVVRKIAAKYGKVSTYKEFAGHAHWVLGEPGWKDIAQYIYDWLLSAKGKPRGQAS